MFACVSAPSAAEAIGQQSTAAWPTGQPFTRRNTVMLPPDMRYRWPGR
jgi:hypothetical protein